MARQSTVMKMGVRLAACAAVAFVWAGGAKADPIYDVTLGFRYLSPTNETGEPTSPNIESQLLAEFGFYSDRVYLRVSNLENGQSSELRGVYLENTTPVQISTEGVGIPEGLGWGGDPTPPNVPGWGSADPVFNALWGATTVTSGVTPGQSVVFNFGLVDGGSWDVFQDQVSSGALRVGIHMFRQPDSSQYLTFVSNNDGGQGGQDPPVIPVPPAAGLILLGMAALGIRNRFSGARKA